MKTKGLPSFNEDYTENAREMITQTRRWAITMRGIAFGPWQGALSHSKAIKDASNPWFDVFTTAHDQWLDLWEAQANAALEGASFFTKQPRA